MSNTAATPTGEDVVVLDLTDLDALLESRHAQRFTEAHVVEWLRTSGGSLTERIMKCAAADLIVGQQSPA
jgi:hypothetical protein